MTMTRTTARIAIVGDRSDAVIAHTKVPEILDGFTRSVGQIDAYWLHSTSIDRDTDFDGFDAIWVTPGSPYESEAGVLRAITAARQTGIPCLGTCAGFQHMLLEFAREVAGMDVHHGESAPDEPQQLLTPLSCSLLGAEATITVLPGTLAADAMGAGPTTERFFCSYGANVEYLPTLEAAGLRVAGYADDGTLRIAELPEHPFFVGCLFQPELSSSASWLHPLLVAFAHAAMERATANTKTTQ